MLGQGAVVTVTDGLDREGAAGLAERKWSGCTVLLARLIWLNPALAVRRLLSPSLRATRQCCLTSIIRPVHNLDSLAGLIAALGTAPTSRRQAVGGLANRAAQERRTMSDALDVLDQVGRWKASGKVAIATVITTWGSSPRPVGSQPASMTQARWSARCRAAASKARSSKEALASIADGQPRLLDFGVTDEQAWDVGLACGGRSRSSSKVN